jgi:hypothetical protein
MGGDPLDRDKKSATMGGHAGPIAGMVPTGPSAGAGGSYEVAGGPEGLSGGLPGGPARDPGSLEAWAQWLDSSGVDTFLGSVVSDAWVRTWQKAWLRVWVEAARGLLVSASWTDRTFLRGLPQELHEFYRQRFPDLPDFSWEGFWEDLVRRLLGTWISGRRRAGSVFPVVFRGESALPVRYEAEVLEGWDRGEVFPDPMQVLVRPMKEDFLGAMKEAAQAAGLRESVRVRVVPVNPHGENSLVLWGLEGPSGGGALYVALRSLREGLVPDSGLAITFAVQGGQPQPVGELDVKARGCARSGLSELMVAEDYTPPSDVRLSVVRIRDLREAEVHALGLARGVRAYLEGLMKSLDDTPWRAGPGGTSHSRDPDCRADSGPEEGHPGEGSSGAGGGGAAGAGGPSPTARGPGGGPVL